MGRSSSPPSPPPPPPPPPREELMDVIDEISGTQAITVVGADGKKKRVVSKLPQTEEEKQRSEFIGKIARASLENVVNLSQFDAFAAVPFAQYSQTLSELGEQQKQDMAELTQIPDFSNYVEEARALGERSINQNFENQVNRINERLNMMGYGDSTVKAEMLASLGAKTNEQLETNRVNSINYGNDLINQAQARNMNTLNMRNTMRNERLQTAQNEYNLELSKAEQVERQKQQALQNQYGVLNMANTLSQQDTAKAMNTMAPQLANQIFQQSNADNLARYQATLQGQQIGYQNQLAHYNAQPQSFGNALLGLGMKSAGIFGGTYAGGKGLSMSGMDTGGNDKGALIGTILGGAMGGPAGAAAGGQIGQKIR